LGAAYVLRDASWLPVSENLPIIRKIRRRITDQKVASILDAILESHERKKASNASSKEGPATNQKNK